MALTVGQLKRLLSDYDENLEVVLDAEMLEINEDNIEEFISLDYIHQYENVLRIITV